MNSIVISRVFVFSTRIQEIDEMEDIDDIPEQNEKIHVHLNANQHSDYISMARTGWGIYPFKPKCQKQWDVDVRKAVAEIETDPIAKSDLRPRLFDANSGLSILLDTGAQVSLWPRSKFPSAIVDPTRKLQAVNGTRIATYGTRQVKIRHPKNKIPYIHTVIHTYTYS